MTATTGQGAGVRRHEPSGSALTLQLDELRSHLFSVAKRRWGFGVACTYLGIVAVPVAVIAGPLGWLGPCIAGALAIAGRWLAWRSDLVRKHAEWLLRANELRRGIGRPSDPKAVADLKAKFSGYADRKPRPRSDVQGYYEADGPPCGRLFVAMLRESSWWTQQLASKACQWAGAATAVVAATSVGVVVAVAHSADASVMLTVYAIVICLVLSSESAILATKYWHLSLAAGEVFTRLDSYLKDEPDDDLALTAASDYQLARASGPLIPYWFKRRYESALQRTWDDILAATLTHDAKA